MKPEVHATLNADATKALLFEAMSTQLANQIAAMKKDGLGGVALEESEQARALILRQANRFKRGCTKLLRDSGEPIFTFIDGTHGLSHAASVFLGRCPPLTGFANPAKVWAYCGLAPGKGKKKGEDPKYNHTLKAFAIMRLAEPCIKHRESPYRRIYDERRAHTVLTHTDWSDGHAHNDARRCVAKAILRDLWAIENGRPVGPVRAMGSDHHLDQQAAPTYDGTEPRMPFAAPPEHGPVPSLSEVLA